ncbi:hypothetical protein GLOTRDRAFT_96996 [Gloeophyllum trabeum ATCC 11539]|uniref:Uncharacterized protein n=1 Tax=Gloeophyllum trabeum (strain ATCC 11539 / FP-39264 / Madison 617) TaxID=670483 RepID=S7PTA0_GLOTA|nr:uncharacterized protein GLOTRDRAFT_96996 [Gloeophyllum trabeum ATCC 11539]EPQ50532.1 hypothetical protein GLOTRDRAFT_96996 [Gloeophyllum trabeum ATCC 11539]
MCGAAELPACVADRPVARLPARVYPSLSIGAHGKSLFVLIAFIVVAAFSTRRLSRRSRFSRGGTQRWVGLSDVLEIVWFASSVMCGLSGIGSNNQGVAIWSRHMEHWGKDSAFTSATQLMWVHHAYIIQITCVACAKRWEGPWDYPVAPARAAPAQQTLWCNRAAATCPNLDGRPAGLGHHFPNWRADAAGLDGIINKMAICSCPGGMHNGLIQLPYQWIVLQHAFQRHAKVTKLATHLLASCGLGAQQRQSPAMACQYVQQYVGQTVQSDNGTTRTLKPTEFRPHHGMRVLSEAEEMEDLTWLWSFYYLGVNTLEGFTGIPGQENIVHTQEDVWRMIVPRILNEDSAFSNHRGEGEALPENLLSPDFGQENIMAVDKGGGCGGVKESIIGMGAMITWKRYGMMSGYAWGKMEVTFHASDDGSYGSEDPWLPDFLWLDERQIVQGIYPNVTVYELAQFVGEEVPYRKGFLVHSEGVQVEIDRIQRVHRL